MTAESGRYLDNDHPMQAAAQLSRTDRNTSLDALHTLEDVLSDPAPRRRRRWLDYVQSALDQLAQALDAQAGRDSETASLLSEIAIHEPRLLPRIEQLRRDHEHLRQSVRNLLDEMAPDADSGDVDITVTRDRVAEVARRLRQHRQREADLVYEAVNINLGTGD
jgi:hypothetical protein